NASVTEAFTVKVFLRDPNGVNPDIYLDTVNVPGVAGGGGIASGASYSTVDWTVTVTTAMAPEGTYDLVAVVDDGLAIAEMDEAN
ncbi:MAG: hypothetical protein GWO08_17245, partial [Gammaproteobacteria bacterium]|nr:hypothetical protein [Gammaproteobacteria bacterium]NIR95329.1 hypothetical protein [Gammaproteobacteria bacterium]